MNNNRYVYKTLDINQHAGNAIFSITIALLTLQQYRWDCVEVKSGIITFRKKKSHNKGELEGLIHTFNDLN